jgi:predicted alpha/beta superfamily hydrolase
MRPDRLFEDYWVYEKPGHISNCKGQIIEHSQFYSPQLGNRRTILVYLPPEYFTSPMKQFPVIYLQDGNNVFDTGTSFAGVAWNVEYAIEELTEEGLMRPCIAVGIYNTMGRMSEYTPSWSSRFEGGEADKYGRFLIDSIKPFIDRNYRTLPDAENTAIMGSSLGGLVSMWLGWTYPDVFSKVGAISTSIWWDKRSIIDEIKDTQREERRGKLQIWLDVGTYEGGPTGVAAVSSMVRDSRDLRELLIDRGFTLHRDLEYFEDVGSGHNEGAWRDRVDGPLTFFFPPED